MSQPVVIEELPYDPEFERLFRQAERNMVWLSEHAEELGIFKQHRGRYVAASGGLIEHWVFFTEYPSRFAAITFVEVLIQAVVLGYIVARFAVRRPATVQGKGSPR